MTPSTWGVIGTLFTIFAGCVAIFYYQQSSSRVAAQLQEAKTAKAVEDATKPRDERIARLERECDRKDAAIVEKDRRHAEVLMEKDRRIDQLEDELRRGRGYGESDASRQPRR